MIILWSSWPSSSYSQVPQPGEPDESSYYSLTICECLACRTNWSRNWAASGKSFLNIIIPVTYRTFSSFHIISDGRLLEAVLFCVISKDFSKDNLHPMHCLMTVKLPGITLDPSILSLPLEWFFFHHDRPTCPAEVAASARRGRRSFLFGKARNSLRWTLLAWSLPGGQQD